MMQCLEQPRDQSFTHLHACSADKKNHDSDVRQAWILLKLLIAVAGEKYVELRRCKYTKFAILDALSILRRLPS